MGERLPELAALPEGLVLDGELVAYGADGRSSFPLLSLRVLLEGVVAKKRTERYLPGERGWVKTKNQDYWRFGSERDLARRRRARLMI